MVLNSSLTQPVFRQVAVALLERNQEVGSAGVKLDNQPFDLVLRRADDAFDVLHARKPNLDKPLQGAPGIGLEFRAPEPSGTSFAGGLRPGRDQDDAKTNVVAAVTGVGLCPVS